MTPPGRLRKILDTARKAGEQHLPDGALTCLGEDASCHFHSDVPGAMLHTTRSDWRINLEGEADGIRDYFSDPYR